MKKKTTKKTAVKSKVMKKSAKSLAKSVKRKSIKKKINPRGYSTVSPKDWQARLDQAFALSNKKEGAPGGGQGGALEEYFAAAASLVQNLPGCLFINLYSAKSALDLSPDKPSFVLFGLSQKDSRVLQQELKRYPFSKGEEKPSLWKEEQVVENLYDENTPFHLYGYEEEKLTSLVLKEKTCALYLPIWSDSKIIGALCIAFEKKAFLHKEIWKHLQAARLFFAHVLMRDHLSISHDSSKMKEMKKQQQQEKKLKASQDSLLKAKAELKNIRDKLNEEMQKNDEQKIRSEETLKTQRELNEIIESLEQERKNSLNIKQELQEQSKKNKIELEKQVKEHELALEKKQNELTAAVEKEHQNAQKTQRELSEILESLEQERKNSLNIKQELQEQSKKNKIELEKQVKEHELALEKKQNELTAAVEKEHQNAQKTQRELSEILESLEQERKSSLNTKQELQEQSKKNKIELEKQVKEHELALEKKQNELTAAVEKEHQNAQKTQRELSEILESLEQERKSSLNTKQELQEQSKKSKLGLEKKQSELTATIKENELELEKKQNEIADAVEKEHQNAQKTQRELNEILESLEQERKNSLNIKQELQEQNKKNKLGLEKKQSDLTAAIKENELELEKRQNELTATVKQEQKNMQKLFDIKHKDVHAKLREKESALSKAYKQLEKKVLEIEQIQKSSDKNLKEHQETDKKLESLKQELQETGLARKEDKKSYQKERAEQELHLEKELARQKEEYSDELLRAAEYKERVRLAEEKEQEIKKDNTSLIEQRSAFLQQIDEAEKKYRAKDEDSKILTKEIVNLKETQRDLKNTVRLQSSELQTSYKTKAALEENIAAYRDRHTHLEKTLLSVNEEIRIQKLHLEREKQKNLELSQKNLNQNKIIEKIQKNLQGAHFKQKKWEIERTDFLQKEKKQNEKFQPFSELLRSVSQNSSLAEKVRYIYTNLSRENPIERVLVYSLEKRGTLQWEGGFWGKEDLFSIPHQTLALKESAFGEVLATLKPQVFHSKNFAGSKNFLGDIDMIDISASIKNHIQINLKDKSRRLSEKVQSVILFPLIESSKVIGFFTLASHNPHFFENRIIEILSHIAPLLAAALHQEKNSYRLKDMESYNQSFRQVNHYLQERYVHVVKHIQKVIQRLERQLPDSIKADLLRNLEFPPSMVLPLASSPQEENLSFIKWIDLLGKRAQQVTGLSFQKEIHLETVRDLNHFVGKNFRSIYWLTSEAVSNVIHHSQATQMRIVLGKENGKIQLAIIDNGDGLARTSERKKNNPAGQGLEAIRNLAKTCGAQVEFGRDEKGHGLAVLVNWPSKL